MLYKELVFDDIRVDVIHVDLAEDLCIIYIFTNSR